MNRSQTAAGVLRKANSQALITGGTGFIGSHLVEALRQQGVRLRVLVRSTSNVSALTKLNVELVRGDLLDRSVVNKAVQGVDIVFHLGAVTRARS